MNELVNLIGSVLLLILITVAALAAGIIAIVLLIPLLLVLPVQSFWHTKAVYPQE